MKAKLSYKEQAENFILWTHKLATTRLKRGYYQLGNQREGFCCLGVACHMFVDKDKWRDHANFYPGLTKIIGLRSKGGIPRDDGKLMPLTQLNDHELLSFYQISKVLMENYKNYLNPKVSAQVTRLLKAAGGRV